MQCSAAGWDGLGRDGMGWDALCPGHALLLGVELSLESSERSLVILSRFTRLGRLINLRTLRWGKRDRRRELQLVVYHFDRLPVALLLGFLLLEQRQICLTGESPVRPHGFTTAPSCHVCISQTELRERPSKALIKPCQRAIQSASNAVLDVAPLHPVTPSEATSRRAQRGSPTAHRSRRCLSRRHPSFTRVSQKGALIGDLRVPLANNQGVSAYARQGTCTHGGRVHYRDPRRDYQGGCSAMSERTPICVDEEANRRD